MTVSIHVTKLNFSSGAEISLRRDTVIVFVGPNSAGKSQSLSDISGLIALQGYKGKAIVDAPFQKIGSNEEYKTFLEKNSFVKDGRRLMPGLSISPSTAVDEEWKNEGLPNMGPVFATLLNAGGRLSAISNRKRVDGSAEIPVHPLPALDLNPKREIDASNSFNEIFGVELAIDRGVGSVVNLHVGKRPDTDTHGGVYSPEFSAAVREMPNAAHEGDGIKAAAGLILSVIGMPKAIYLVDEPDVYLHPPQAFNAAKELVRISRGKQLFLSTHNAHFVRGLLESEKSRLLLVRLDRSKGHQYVHIIDQQVFEDVKSDPLMKFSTLLEALFFRTVVVCENEADCLFYRSFFVAVGNNSRYEDIFWMSSHGKQNIKKLVLSLRKMGVNVISIPDLDIINNKTNLKDLIESHGANWNDYKTDYDVVAKLIATRKPTFAIKDVRLKISEVLQNTKDEDDGLFPDDSAEQIKATLRSASPWRELKESGITALGTGTNRQAAQRLLDRMQASGILAPQVGEMESFYPLSSKHGNEWVNEVLQLDIKNDPNLADARAFAKKLHIAVVQ